MKGKICSLWVAAVLLLMLLPMSALAVSTADRIDLSDTDNDLQSAATASGGQYSYDDITKKVTIHTGPVTITGATTERVVEVAAGASVSLTLENVLIDLRSRYNGCPISLTAADACEVILATGSVNELRAGANRPAIHVPSAKKLTITGEGTLNSFGGDDWPAIGREGGTGIIEIQNGHIAADAGANAAGIGGSYGFRGGSITIAGGTITAVGSNVGGTCGIGDGYYSQTGNKAVLTFTGGSINATVSETVTNGYTNVTMKTIAASGGSGNAVVSQDVTTAASWMAGGLAADPQNQVYGISGAFADSGGSAYLWLPELATPQIAIQGGAAPQVAIGDPRTLELGNSGAFAAGATFQWYLVPNAGSNNGGTPVAGAAGSTLTVDTAQAGSYHYYLAVTDSGKISRSNPLTIMVKYAAAQMPNITAHPQSAYYQKDAAAAPLTVTAAVTDGGTLSCQWYRNTANSNTGGTLLPGETGFSYTPPTGAVGTLYYYCVVTNTNTDAIDPTPVAVTGNLAKINVTSAGSPGKTDASVSTACTRYDRNTAGMEHSGIIVTLASGSYTLREITLDGVKLTPNADYTVNGSRYIFSGEFLETLADGGHRMVFSMSGGTSPALTVTVYDSTPQIWANPFSDVKAGDWFYGDVEYVHLNGLFKGTSKMTFSPGITMDRGMLVTVLGRLSGEKIPQAGFDMPFRDVSVNHYAAPYIAWASEHGIVEGFTANTFGAEKSLTREQIAEILYRYAVYKGKAPSEGMQEVGE